MSLKQLYNAFMEAVDSGNPDKISYAGIEWISQVDENPFEENTPERTLFFNAKRNLRKWDAQGIDYRISFRRAVDCIGQLGNLKIPNPHKDEEPVHVLGIIPDTADEPKEEIQEKPAEETVEENKPIIPVPEESKSYALGDEKPKTPKKKKRFFGREKDAENNDSTGA